MVVSVIDYLMSKDTARNCISGAVNNPSFNLNVLRTNERKTPLFNLISHMI